MPSLQIARARPAAAGAPTRRKQSGEEIEEAVPGAGEGKRPGVATAQAEWSGGKLDAVERNSTGIAADLRCELRAEPGGGSDAVATEARGKIHAVNFPPLRHVF